MQVYYFCGVKQEHVPEMPCLIRFRTDVSAYPLPDRFTFPFYYEPEPLSQLAAAELQELLHEPLHTGKMFGVLVVRDPEGNLGYLTAFSGRNNPEYPDHPFVPLVYDAPSDDAWYRQEEARVHAMSLAIEALEKSPDLQKATQRIADEKLRMESEKTALKQRIKLHKQQRDELRRSTRLSGADETTLKELEERLKGESMRENLALRDLTREHQQRLQSLHDELEHLRAAIIALKHERKSLSQLLQQYIFTHFCFLDANGNEKSIQSVFALSEDLKPPSGAGDCAAPKLLQYAYRNGLHPVSMAEFWWGPSHSSEIRKHGVFYPSCRGKCEPILGHMLQGLTVRANPLEMTATTEKDPQIVYEDDHLAVINKPFDFLSVPGKMSSDSVYERMRLRYPQATGSLIVHRLDMATSGLLLIAKTKEAHHQLQRQFLKKTVKKRYVALLEGTPATTGGTIELPLRVDLDDRPRQLVCYEHGKRAVTEWKIVEQTPTHTRVHFWPITGRTHQLRVHAAHPLGLNCPIAGDDLYGSKSERLYLHAESIRFIHPATGNYVEFEAPAGF